MTWQNFKQTLDPLHTFSDCHAVANTISPVIGTLNTRGPMLGHIDLMVGSDKYVTCKKRGFMVFPPLYLTASGKDLIGSTLGKATKLL